MDPVKKVWFRRGDGMEFCAVDGSDRARLYVKEGFEPISGPKGAEVDAPPSDSAEGAEGDDATGPLPEMKDGESDEAYLARLNKAHLLAVAAQRGMPKVEEGATKAQIIAAILAFKPAEGGTPVVPVVPGAQA